MAAKARPRKGTVKETPYQKRIRRYAELHPGAPKQAARGHKKREHVKRKAHDIAAHGMTSYEKGRVKMFANAAAKRTGHDSAEIFDTLKERIRERGYAEFKENVAGFVTRLSRSRKGRGNVIEISGRAANIGDMQDIADDWDIDLEWLWYG